MLLVHLSLLHALFKLLLGLFVLFFGLLFGPLQLLQGQLFLLLRLIVAVIASRYQLGRVFLIGDAAHVHSPMGGPGLNLGLQDAVNLGWKLATVLNGRVEPALLATYEAERRPAAERVIMHGRARLALVRPGPEVTALRELFSELLTDPDIVRRLSDQISGAENRYGASADAHPLAGHWVPEFSVENTSGTRRVAELARSGRPLLLDLTDRGEVAAAQTDVADQLTVAAGRPSRQHSSEGCACAPRWLCGAGRHDEVLHKAIGTHGGWLFKHTGDGVCAAFASPRCAVDAAVAAQRELKLR